MDALSGVDLRRRVRLAKERPAGRELRDWLESNIQTATLPMMKRPTKGYRNHAAVASGTSLLATSAAKSAGTAISFSRSLAKVCFAGTLIALSFAVTYTSSPDAFSHLT